MTTTKTVIYRTIITNEDRQTVSARNFEILGDAEELAEHWFNRMLGRESDYGTLTYIAVQKLEHELKSVGLNIWETVSEFEF
jgi:hypothetical protein